MRGEDDAALPIWWQHGTQRKPWLAVPNAVTTGVEQWAEATTRGAAAAAPCNAPPVALLTLLQPSKQTTQQAAAAGSPTGSSSRQRRQAAAMQPMHYLAFISFPMHCQVHILSPSLSPSHHCRRPEYGPELPSRIHARSPLTEVRVYVPGQDGGLARLTAPCPGPPGPTMRGDCNTHCFPRRAARQGGGIA